MPTGTPALPAQSRQSVTTRVNRPSGTSPGASAFPSSASPALAVEVAPRTLARQSPQGSQRFVFANTLGRSLDDRDVGEGFRQTIKSAGLAPDGKRLSLHWLRHGYASLLVANELNVVFVSMWRRAASTAWWAERHGQKPKLQSEKRGSKTGVSTCERAWQISRSTAVGTPSVRRPPEDLGIITLLTGCGR